MVLLLPPAPAARVLLGRVFAARSARSAAAFRRITARGPPGGVGDDGRAPVLAPVLVPLLPPPPPAPPLLLPPPVPPPAADAGTGELDRGVDYTNNKPHNDLAS
jgi:hypothetical protein